MLFGLPSSPYLYQRYISMNPKNCTGIKCKGQHIHDPVLKRFDTFQEGIEWFKASEHDKIFVKERGSHRPGYQKFECSRKGKYSGTNTTKKVGDCKAYINIETVGDHAREDP